MFDSKWLSELLQATGPKSLAFAIAGGIIYFGRIRGWPGFDDLPAWSVAAGLGAMVIFGCLAAVSLAGEVANRTASVAKWGVAKLASRRRRADFLLGIDEQLTSLTTEEATIVAYLVTNDQQYFTGAADGGRAATLIARGFIQQALRPGYHASFNDVPFKVQDDVWARLKDRAAEFMHPNPGRGPHPWRERLF